MGNTTPPHTPADAMGRTRWNPFGDLGAVRTLADNPQDDDAGGLNLVELWRSVSKRKWAILGFALVVSLLTAAVTLTLTPVYRASTVIMFEPEKSKVMSLDELFANNTGNRDYLQTQLEILKSREVAERTVKALELWNHPAYDPRRPSKGVLDPVLGPLRQALGMVEPEVPQNWTPERLVNAVLGTFRAQLSVELVRGSSIANIHFESSDPVLAAKAANALAKAYVENDLNARYVMTRQASEWLQERVSDLKSKVVQSERELQNYRESTGIISAQGATQSGASSQLEGLTARLIEARLRRADAETVYSQIRSAPPGADLSEIPAVLRTPGMSEAKRAAQEAERKFNEIAQRYGPEHPRHVAGKAELEASTASLKRQLDNTVGTLRREFEAAQAVEREIQRALDQSRSSVVTLNRSEFQLGVLQREVESNREMYNLFMTRAKETSNTSDLQSPIARVVDSATQPSSPIKPNKTRIVLVAFALALLLAVGASLLVDQLDQTLKTSEDVEKKLGVPLLTALPLLNHADARRASSARLFADQPNSVFAESVRTARTGVLLSGLDQEQRILLVTSSLPGEGKSTFSINLALSHAQTQRTLLIDADMRRPSVAKSLDIAPGIKGLSAFVAGNANVVECSQNIEGTQLTVMPSGVLPPNPLELISSRRFKERLAELAQLFDVIIIDSPPVDLVSDALMISSLSTGVIYVVRAMGTPIPVIAKGLERVRRAEGQLIGLVLNQYDFKRASKYYGEYSGYGSYGYGKKGYGTAYGQGYVKASA